MFEPAVQQTIRALLVEDNPGDAELATERLSRVGGVAFHITVKSSLQAAREALGTSPFDVVLVDLNLPDSVGLETLRQIREMRPVVPFVVLSSAVDARSRAEALREGAEEVISKDEANSRLFPLSVLRVLERIRSDEDRLRLSKILETSPDAVVVVDQAGAVQYVNEAAVSMFGVPRAELVRERLGFSIKEGDRVEVRLPRADGSGIGEMRVVDFEWRGKRSSLAAIRDVTDQKKLETQLVVADRLAAMGTLAAGVAHEINNPLSAIVANLALATQHLDELEASSTIPAELREELRDAQEAAERVRLIARDLKLFSRPNDDVRGPVDIHKVLDSTLRMAWNEVRHRAQVVKEYSPTPLPFVDGNESRLGQVFLNLIVNAAQAMKEGAVSSNELRISTALEGDLVMVRITDTGPGIPPHVQKRLFDPFYTTKPVGEGTGLGLAISLRIITNLGGSLTFESHEGKGTCFTVALRTSDAERALPVAKQVSAAPRGRVLMVDDDPSILRTLSRILAKEHDVVAADSGRAALERIKNGERYDVILCDMMMPEMTGMEFFEALKQLGLGAEQRVVFVTGGAFTPSTTSFLASVPNRTLEKPFDGNGVRQLMRDLLLSSPSPQG